VMVGCWAAFAVPDGLATASSNQHRSPAKAFLGAGRVGPFKWSVLTFSPHGPAPSHTPCLQLKVRAVRPDPLEIGLGEVICGAVRPGPVKPFLNISVVDELIQPPITFEVMAFPANVASVSLFFKGPLRDRVLPLKLLSRGKAQRTGLAPFRYYTLAFSGRSCLVRFVTHTRSGAVHDHGEHMGCGFATKARPTPSLAGMWFPERSSAESLAAPARAGYWNRCGDTIRAHNFSCRKAREIGRAYLRGLERFVSSPRPRGFLCKARQVSPKHAFYVACRRERGHRLEQVRFSYEWG